ncbi:hypothetical protein JQS43_07460 [Natronosporangium hydrolyticum]|uniref:Uncharacterized protein n=1 Tax=Natronosporangium hydrolyticum TaxID=2811111 RepID=A0A895YEX4_9ACTN|nr:DUF5947 family protein [Natronosporangium hydrolyticum]QSB16131.1 hypothetical protein JQS43_07460 [Natronosporangium hydrolyticum]
MTTGLRRFAVPPPFPTMAGEPAEPAGERCELCAVPVPEGDHGHLVDRTARRLACACRACYLLFTGAGGAGRYQAIPAEYWYAPTLPLRRSVWDRLGIPVGLAFFFENSGLGQLVALYPSPAGATESLLSLDAWSEVVTAAPQLSQLTPDVTAFLVNRLGSGDRAGRRAGPEPIGDTRFEGFVVPIDACYRLVGLVRTHWRGFDGGEEAWREIDAFLADLRARSTLIRTGDHAGL